MSNLVKVTVNGTTNLVSAKIYQAQNGSSAWADITGKPAAVTALSGTNTGDQSLAGYTKNDTTSTVVVLPDGTDTQRGTTLVAAYAAAKLLTPNGVALSSTNRARVMIPPGAYKVTSTLVFDTNYVDFFATEPARGRARLSTDSDNGGDSATSLTQFRPPPTYIYSDASSSAFTVAKQTCADAVLRGFGIAYLGTVAAFDEWNFKVFLIDLASDDANKESIYDTMYFWHRSAAADIFSEGGRECVVATKNFKGTWVNCHANSYAFRVGPAGVMTAVMTDCTAGAYSFGGDAVGASMVACKITGCESIGDADGLVQPGAASFGGCNVVGIPADSGCVFTECISGNRSFNPGVLTSAQYIRCRAGTKSFGATVFNTDVGEFAGYAEDCISGADSFGGTSAAGYGKCSGTLVRCIGEGNTKSMRLEGAEIWDSRITTETTGIHGVTLLDSNSRVVNSDILVYEGGTGIPVYAATALNVYAFHCRFNNFSNDADGFGANVTNTASTLALTANKLSAFAATTSAELAGVVSDETGTGALVFANSPAFVTPALGTPASGNLANCTGFPVTLGANTFTGQQQLAASQAATDANSAMSRGLADARSLVSAQGSNLTINNSDTYNATSMTLTLTAGTWELGGFFQTLNAATGGAKIYISVVSGASPESYQHRFFMMAVNGGSTNPLFSGGAPTYGAGTFPFRFSVAMASGAGSFITIAQTIIVLTATARLDIGFSQNTAVVGDATLYSFSKFWARRLTH